MAIRPRMHATGTGARHHQVAPTVKRLRGSRLMARNARIKARYPLCPLCEAKGIIRESDEVDHRVPLIAGGADDETNLWALCHDCHAAKTAEENRRRTRGEVPLVPGLMPLRRPRPVFA